MGPEPDHLLYPEGNERIRREGPSALQTRARLRGERPAPTRLGGQSDLKRSRARARMVTVARDRRGGTCPSGGGMVLQHSARARTGRTTPTEREALLGSPEHRSRSQGYGLARKIVGTVVLGTCVGVAALSSQTRGYFMRSMGYTDPRPYIVDFGDSVSPSFKHQAFVYRCDGESDADQAGGKNHHGMYDYYAVTQVTVGEPSFEKCYTSTSPLIPDTVPKPVYFTEMAAHKGEMIGTCSVAREQNIGGLRQRLRVLPEDAARARPELQPRARELRHRLVRRGDEPDARDGGEVLQLRQGVPGEHAER